jgi:hypothetical protein
MACGIVARRPTKVAAIALANNPGLVQGQQIQTTYAAHDCPD